MPRAPEDALNVCTRVPLHSRSHLPSEEKHAGRPVSKPPAIQWSWYEGAMTPPLVFGTSARVRKTGGICVRNAKDSDAPVRWRLYSEFALRGVPVVLIEKIV
eukprot:8024670-Pyramimonas_sp.AAC.1